MGLVIDEIEPAVLFTKELFHGEPGDEGEDDSPERLLAVEAREVEGQKAGAGAEALGVVEERSIKSGRPGLEGLGHAHGVLLVLGIPSPEGKKSADKIAERGAPLGVGKAIVKIPQALPENAPMKRGHRVGGNQEGLDQGHEKAHPVGVVKAPFPGEIFLEGKGVQGKVPREVDPDIVAPEKGAQALEIPAIFHDDGMMVGAGQKILMEEHLDPEGLPRA